MTLLVGANLKHYILLAADTRTTLHDPLLGKFHRDDDHKIVMCSMGLITGSGYVNALDSVKHELLSKEISHTDQILKIINELAKPEIEKLHKYDPNIKDYTCFLISYFTNINNESILRLSFLHPAWDYQLNLIQESIIVMPVDTKREDYDKYSQTISERLNTFRNSKIPEREYLQIVLSNIIKNVIIFAECFDEISKISNFVSKYIDFAALLSNGIVIYGYGDSRDIISGKLKFSIIPNSNQSRILNPDIFNEGEMINL